MSDLVSVRFRVFAEASPGLLPRLLEPLAKRDLIADAVHAVRDGDDVRADMVVHAMPAEMVRLVAGNLGQVIGVMNVTVDAAMVLRAAA